MIPAPAIQPLQRRFFFYVWDDAANWVIENIEFQNLRGFDVLYAPNGTGIHTLGDNITQTVLIASDEWLEAEGSAEAMERLLAVWDEAVAIIDGAPDAWRETLVEKSRLPEPLKDMYAVNTYPRAQLPTEEQVREVIDWMKATDLLNGVIPYHKLVWE